MTYLERITEAIASLHERGGSSRQAISSWLASKYTDCAAHHGKALGFSLQ
jgi:hypothetical protein